MAKWKDYGWKWTERDLVSGGLKTSLERRRNLSLKGAHEPGSSHAEDGRFPAANYHGLSVCLSYPPPPAVFCLIVFLFPHLTAVNCTLTRTHDCLYLPAGEDICPCFHNSYLHRQKREFQWRTEGGGCLGVQTPPKFRRFDIVEPDCKFSGKYLVFLVFLFQHHN
jgi:hypothetical protein